MSRIALAVAAVLSTSAAYADNIHINNVASTHQVQGVKPASPAKPGKYCPPKKSTASPTSNVTSQSQSSAAAAATSVATSHSSSAAQGGSAVAANDSHNTARGGNASAAGGSATGGDASGQSTNIQSDSSYREVRQTPPAFAGTVQPTASCKNAINGGASAPIAGISFGFGKGDEECDRRELARSFYEMGDREDALLLLCQSRLAKKLPACAQHAEDSGFVTRDELNQRDRELIRHGVGK